MPTTTAGPGRIHALGLAYLQAKDAWEAAYASYIAALRQQYGPKANAFTQPQDRDGQAVKAARECCRLCGIVKDTALTAMRAAGATVHPITEEK